MIQLTPHMRILVAASPVDFRKGIDGLAAVCRQELKNDPFSGTVFVFVNKSRSALRLLFYDGQGFWLCHKRLSSGRFTWNFGHTGEIAARELQVLLWNVDPLKMANAEDFRPIAKKFKKSSGHTKYSLL